MKWEDNLKFETGKCLLVSQEGKGKSDLWKTFDIVVGNTGDQENRVYERALCEYYVCQTGAVRLRYIFGPFGTV